MAAINDLRGASRRRLWQASAALGGALVLVITAILVTGHQTTDMTDRLIVASPASVQSLIDGIPQKNVTLGRPSAPVTVTEFADLLCPDCADYTELLFPELVRNYVKTGKVRMVFRSFPVLGPGSVSPALAAAAAGRQDKLWNFVDAFYYESSAEGGHQASKALLRQVGHFVAGLNVDRMLNDLPAASSLAQVKRSIELGRDERIDGMDLPRFGRHSGLVVVDVF